MYRKTCFTIHLLTQSLFSLKSSKPVASTSLITHRDPSAHWISNLEWTVLIPPTQESRHAAISVANSYNEVKSPYKISGLQQHKIRKTKHLSSEIFFFFCLHYPRRTSVSPVALRHPSLSCATSLLLTISIFMSFSTSSFHLALHLPVGCCWCKLAWFAFLVFLASSILCRCHFWYI